MTHLTLWFILPSALLLTAYAAVAYEAWPHARPRFPLGILLLAILFPPFFPLLLVSIFCIPPPPLVLAHPPTQIVVVEAPRRRPRR